MTETPAPARERGAALVTGGAKRIGRAICLELAAAGFDVAVHHRDSEAEAGTLVRDIEALGRRAVALSADLADVVATHELIGRAAEALGPLSVLVNNASVFADDRLDTITGESWSEHLDTNLRAPVLLAQVFARQAPDGSVIVNILDQRVLKPDPRFFSYGLSKSALWFATRTMAQALAPRIRVNGVGPGPTLPSVHQTAEDFAAEAGAVPLERPGSPEAVA
ncbi:MAG: SDR family oxidoreductase, partial [Brevundimonas sp.]